MNLFMVSAKTQVIDWVEVQMKFKFDNITFMFHRRNSAAL